MARVETYNSKAARAARETATRVRRMVREFGDPNGGLGYVDPYVGPFPMRSQVFGTQMGEVNHGGK